MTEPKKVLFTSIGLGQGGVRDSYTYNFVTKEMEALVKAGVDVYFFHERFHSLEIINGVKCLGGQWFSVVGRPRLFWHLVGSIRDLLFPLSVDFRKAVWAVKVNLSIADLVRDLNIDLIHSHFFYPLGLNCAITKKLVKIPVVSTLRGAELHNRPDLDYGACRERLYRLFLGVGLKSANYVTAPNPELIKMLGGKHKVDGEIMSLVPNGFERLDPDGPGIDFRDAETLHLLSVGNCISLKNHQLVIESIKRVSAYHGIKVHLTIVGRGVLSSELQAQIGDAPVTIIDEMKKSTLASYMKGADALVHASFLEGMPNVVLEALSLGTPCFASDIAAHRMLIEPGSNGYLFDPARVEPLCELLMRAAKDKSRLQKMSTNCIELSKRYSLEKKVGRYLEIYDSLLETNNALEPTNFQEGQYEK